MLMSNRNHEATQFLESDAANYAEELKSIEQAIGLREFSEPDSDYQRLKQATDNVCEACLDIEHKISNDRELLGTTRMRFRETIAPWFHKSPLFFHGISKPRGYAGDYQMLIAIYEGKVRSTGIGGYLDYYFLNTALAKAVVSRMKGILNYLEDEIPRRKEDFSILDIACGPCQEFIQGIALPNDKNIQVSLLDYDRGALAYVKENVVAPRNDSSHFQCIRYNALRMRSADRFIQQHGKYDIIYSVGLCDYIADKQLIPMLSGWRKTAHDGGIVYVAFKDANLYSTPIYQWVTDWHFLQRTQEDCTRIMSEAGFDVESMKVTRDESGVIMNFIAPVAAAQKVRIDQAHSPIATPARLIGQIPQSDEVSQVGSGELSAPEAN